MTREEFLACVSNQRKLSNKKHTFITVYAQNDPYVKNKTFLPLSVIDWGCFSNSREAATLAKELATRCQREDPVLVDKTKSGGGLSIASVKGIYPLARKTYPYNSKTVSSVGKGMTNTPAETSVWVQNHKFEPYSKGLVLLGDSYHYFAKDFFDCPLNNQTKENAIEVMLRLFGPSKWTNREITSYSSWYLYVFEMSRNGILKKQKLSFTDELMNLYNTTDDERMKTLNHWGLPIE